MVAEHTQQQGLDSSGVHYIATQLVCCTIGLLLNILSDGHLDNIMKAMPTEFSQVVTQFCQQEHYLCHSTQFLQCCNC